MTSTLGADGLTEAQQRTAELLNRLRNVVADRAAESLGTLDPREPLALLAAYLFVRRNRLQIPEDLHHALGQRVLELLEGA